MKSCFYGIHDLNVYIEKQQMPVNQDKSGEYAKVTVYQKKIQLNQIITSNLQVVKVNDINNLN